ncbi:hypothetical protein NT239_08960 [Chitinibacter sp. SCUT-21]|uniref:hypothetical protein n=1 Tax=Chitinibacter sp. SCUT-21 TaxID=2970891 RepID=UPI0035A60CB4
MHIVASQLQLTSAQQQEREEWQSLAVSANPGPSFAQMIEQIKDERRSSAAPPERADEGLSAKRRRFQTLLELLFGEPHRCSSTLALPSLSSAPLPSVDSLPQLQLTSIRHVRESESCSMNGNGNVCLADGSQRQFSVGFALYRSATFSAVSLGSAVLRDPLVVDFGSPSMALQPHKFDFDLNADGVAEAVRFPQAEMLFLDRNGNGKVDNGHELFGALSGDGFAELAQLDGDANGWIDAQDTVFNELKLWRGGQIALRSLNDAGVGALAVRAVATPMSEKLADTVLAQLKASSVWLGESGGVGTIRQIDLNTEA